MTDHELQKLLKEAAVPERPADHWEDFPHRVIRGLRASRPIAGAVASWKPRLAWGLAFAAVSVVAGFVLVHWPWRAKSDSLSELQNEKVLREVLTMFPNRVRAIEQDAHGIELSLSDKADVPASTPLWIKICNGKSCRAVVTFSGQELQIAKGKAVVLVDARGLVMLAGDGYVWSSAEPERSVDGLRIQARALAYTL